jgi:hypothetical protein
MSRFHLQCNQLELFVKHIVLLRIISSARTFFFVQLALVSRALESLENQNTGDQGKVNVPLQATKLCPQNIAGVSVGRNIPCSQSYQ